MIRVRRPPKPTSLQGKQSPGEKERAAAVAHFGRKSKKKFKFRAYKAHDIAAALEQAFHHKCAYCESSYRAVMPMDVEHYRPKGAVYVNGKVSSPGYYWLAAEWTNLLPSCIDCNRERKQRRVVAAGKTLARSGKANHFPLLNKRPPTRKVGCERSERPLLLNPCVDDPTLYLEFTDDGMVCPRLAAPVRIKRASTTIEILGLQRSGLVAERGARAKMTLAGVARVQRLQKKRARQKRNQSLKRELLDELRLLKDYALPSSPYSGMVRDILNRALKLKL